MKKVQRRKYAQKNNLKDFSHFRLNFGATVDLRSLRWRLKPAQVSKFNTEFSFWDIIYFSFFCKNLSPNFKTIATETWSGSKKLKVKR